MYRTERPDDGLHERLVVTVTVIAQSARVVTRTAHGELLDVLMRRDDWEDIVLQAKAMIEQVEGLEPDPDDMHDVDWYITHWTLDDYLEDGVLNDTQWLYFERNIDQAAFADFMRCMNGMDCDCK